MRYMHWSWDQLQATPEYVRRYCLDMSQMRTKAEHDAQEKANREAARG